VVVPVSINGVLVHITDESDKAFESCHAVQGIDTVLKEEEEEEEA